MYLIEKEEYNYLQSLKNSKPPFSKGVENQQNSISLGDNAKVSFVEVKKDPSRNNETNQVSSSTSPETPQPNIREDNFPSSSSKIQNEDNLETSRPLKITSRQPTSYVANLPFDTTPTTTGTTTPTPTTQPTTLLHSKIPVKIKILRSRTLLQMLKENRCWTA